MSNLVLSVVIVTIAVLSIPVVMALFLAAWLFEEAHGGCPVKLCKGIDFKKMGMAG